MDIQSYLASKGLDVQVESESQLTTRCVFCGKDGHLHINSNNGLWNCKRCGETGTIKKIQKHFGDNNDVQLLAVFTGSEQQSSLNIDIEKYQRAVDLLMFDPVQMKWLTEERGLTHETIEHFKLGLKKNLFSKENQADVEWITVPLIQNEQIVNVKYRTGAPYKKDFKHIKGGILPLFNHDGVVEGEPLILCEGEFDAMILWQHGFTNVLSTTGGCTSFKAEWFDYVLSLKPPIVYVLYDTDVPGQTGAKDLCQRFGDLAKNIVLPFGKDATEYFVTYKKDSKTLQALLDKAALSDLESVITINGAIDTLIEQEEAELLNIEYTLKTPWASVNKLISGKFEPGEMVVISAQPGIGKTTLALNMAYDLAKNHDTPILFMCLEMRPERLVKKLVSIALQLEDMNIRKEDYDTAKQHFMDVPFYFSYFWDDVSLDKIEKVFTQARRRFGIKLAVFDNLHFLPRSASNTTAEMSIASKRFKKLAENLGIPILLIAQPRKIEDNGIISSNDLKDTSAIRADADKVILLHRELMMHMVEDVPIRKNNDLLSSLVSPTESAYHPLTLIKVDKSRYGSGGATFLWFDGAKSSYRNATLQEVSDFRKIYQTKKETKKRDYSGEKRF